MKRIALLATTALTLGYSHGVVDTVMVKKGAKGEPFRMNRDDFDADQAEGGAKEYTEVKNDDADADGGERSDVNVTGAGVDGEVKTTAAPSAPNFGAPEGAAIDPVDEVKQAVAPKSTTADQLLVMKEGTGKNAKFYITDGMGAKITGDRAKLLKIDENGYDSEETAKAVQTHTNPEPSPN